MKKWILTLCLVFGLATLSACVETNYGPVSDEAAAVLTAQAEDAFETCFRQTAENQTITAMYDSYVEDGNETMANAMQAWEQVQPDLGDFVGIKSCDITTTEDGYDVEMHVDYTGHDLKVSLLSDKKITGWTSIAVEAQYSFGEKMEKAALNTVLGMGTVFVVLFIIIGVISCFKFINKFQDAQTKKKAAAEPAPAPAPAAPVEEVVEEEDDLALIAVITAAIAASENTSVDVLVVRSIRRAGTNNWKRF